MWPLRRRGAPRDADACDRALLKHFTKAPSPGVGHGVATEVNGATTRQHGPHTHPRARTQTKKKKDKKRPFLVRSNARALLLSLHGGENVECGGFTGCYLVRTVQH